MNTLLRALRVELIKICSSKLWWIISAIVVIIQPLLAFIAARSYLRIGLDATTENHPELIQALPPLDYFGFEAVVFGLLAMVILGGMIGAGEYKHHQLRTTLLCQSSRRKVFCAKAAAFIICIAVLALLSIYATITITHYAFGEQGLHPIYLSTIAWQFIGYSVLDWCLLSLLAFGIGMLFRNAIVPLAFLIPQIYNLGNFLAQKWDWGGYLPVAAGNLLFATPTDSYEHDPLQGGIVLLIWVLVACFASYYAFTRHDVGGKY